ncbi:MAG TPA: biopolymer transporter ExbD [Flavobacteriaceae bacterium]|nr:biopolymer transporter ExbD [Flavobacteriaceae bacterium]
MSKFRKKKEGDLPAISTASLPDVVFMLLFFFMVATVLRDSTLMIENRLPVADQLEKLDKKDMVMYIYAGQPKPEYQEVYGTEARIQLNDKFADIKDIQAFIQAERATKPEELVPLLTTSLKIDRETNMGIVSDIKQELRRASALKINYTTGKGESSRNLE